MNKNAKQIRVALNLRQPQIESLEIFEKICVLLSLTKSPDLEAELVKIHNAFPTLTDFEREFPSVCFALATGIGKTRLMGAFIAYLYYEKGIRNFFVMAPNLTIYEKLKADLGSPSSSKYVFRGLDAFVTPPRIIDGDNYEEFRMGSLLDPLQPITINIFNISKLNSDSKSAEGQPARIKRLHEVLGQSYFEYLQSLPDLVILMDESHHYHADKSFNVINELRPIIGVELTATPQIQKGATTIKFKNVVYEYSLAHALDDQRYVKIPIVVTRRDFRPEQYTPEPLDHEKLRDGIRLHEDTKSKLDIYARTHDKPIVKPFVLVVAKDTDHSKRIFEFITSPGFFHGYYRDKVIEINSAQRGEEKDENIRQLLSLEKPENKVEIVIHVNMLKEGWDVTNLYTIIPLRASASETLTEQTIGRGLRLPYGDRTGVEEVDRLSIVSHDRYEAIIALANDPNSLVRRLRFIEEEELGGDDRRVTIEMPALYDELTISENRTEQLALELPELIIVEPVRRREVAKFVSVAASKAVFEVSRHARNMNAVQDDELRSIMRASVVDQAIRAFPSLELKPEVLHPVADLALDYCVQALTEHVIPIPQGDVRAMPEVAIRYESFDLDTRSMYWQPGSDDLLATELQVGGKTSIITPGLTQTSAVDTPENEIVKQIILHDNIDYSKCADLIYVLIAQAKEHFFSYLHTKEAVEKVMRNYNKRIADMIYEQMSQNFYHEEVSYQAASMRPFSRIETNFGSRFESDEVFDLRATLAPSEVKSKVFKGFKKACHTLYKFDSDTERRFAIVLENDPSVIRWLRPSPKQFSIFYGREAVSKYEPDFIVETGSCVYMVETKARKELESEEVVEKAKAGREYCRAASAFNKEIGGKPWVYLLIPHDEVQLSFGFEYVAGIEPLA